MKKLAWLLMVLVLAVSGIAMGAEQASGNMEGQDQYPNPVRDMMATYGKITSVSGSTITVEGEGNYPKIVVRIKEDTYFLNGETGAKLSKSDFGVGKAVTAYYSSYVNKGYPPKTDAYALVSGGIGEETGKFFRVSSVTKSEDTDNAVVILNSNHDIKAIITQDACANYAMIAAGDTMLVWYSALSFSIPAETTANKAVIINK
jgi:hypothetical protein